MQSVKKTWSSCPQLCGSFVKEDRSHTYTHTHTRLMALFRDYPDEPVRERLNQSGFYWNKRLWVALASAGPYASLHLAPGRQPCQHLSTQFFYRPDALPAAQPTASKHWRLNSAVTTILVRVITVFLLFTKTFKCNMRIYFSFGWLKFQLEINEKLLTSI